MLLKGKTALITGASRGIGMAITELFAQNGANLILVVRQTNQPLEAFVEELKSNYGVSINLKFADVTDYEGLANVFKELQLQKNYIDILVNNAGIMIDAVLQMAKPDLMHKIYETNVFGTMYASQFAIKHMLKQKHGSIINLTSIIGTKGNGGQTIYGSSKTAVIGFTMSLAKELAPFQIRVNGIAPGFIDTDMTKSMDPKFYEKNIQSIGMKRIGKPADVAKVALFLASDLSEYVTGQVIGVDGGMII